MNTFKPLIPPQVNRPVTSTPTNFNNRGRGHNRFCGPYKTGFRTKNQGRYSYPHNIGNISSSFTNNNGTNNPTRHKNQQNVSRRSNYYTPRENRPYFSDPLIITRVSQYIKTMGTNDIDFDEMVEYLQTQHVDYRRKKLQAFRHHVRKALEVINLENSLNEDEDQLDEENYEEDDTGDRRSPEYALEGDGDVNSTLEDSYLQQNANKKRKVSDSTPQELISIVTSDEEDTETISTTKPAEVVNEGGEEKKDDDAVLEPMPTVEQPPPPLKKRRTESSNLIKNSFKALLEPLHPSTSFKDIGGNEKVLQEVTQLLIHMRHPEVYRVLGVSPPRGFLLHGPPGSGKTLLAHSIAGELGVSLLRVAAPELVGGLSGQSEERIRDLFEQAVALVPCVLFIDEVDAITPNRETAHREMERRIVAQLLASMDELASNCKADQVLVIGATNRPDSLDPALRRSGRFDREVCLGIPDRDSRGSILDSLCRSLRLSPELSLQEVAALTPGYVGADLKSLVTEAAMAAVNRLFKSLNESPKISDNKILNTEDKEVGKKEIKSNPKKRAAEPSNKQQNEDEDIMIVDEKITPLEADNTDDGSKIDKGPDEQSKDEQSPPLSLLHSCPLTAAQLEGVYITMEDFVLALKSVQPSAKREGFATVPDVKWEDIGSLQDIRHELQMAILGPVKHPKEFAAMGLENATGVLLCGPPGCGKTLLAKAIANEAGINFISVKGPELLNMYVGESERAVRQCFQRARSSQPCVIFFDEIDALCPKRTNMENGASRVVNQLLTEMDGVEGRAGVFLMAATNRPDIVDPAVMRPGRLDKVLYVGLPAPQDRVDILQALTKRGKRPVLAEDVDIVAIASDKRCGGYSGADLAALVREASTHALKEYMASENRSDSPDLRVSSRHFNSALDKIRPSVSDRSADCSARVSSDGTHQSGRPTVTSATGMAVAVQPPSTPAVHNVCRVDRPPSDCCLL